MRTLWIAAFTLWAADGTLALAQDAAPRVDITRASAGSTLELEVSRTPDGPITIEVTTTDVDGNKTSFPAIPATVRNGKASVVGPYLGEEERFRAVNVRVLQNGKVIASSARYVS